MESEIITKLTQYISSEILKKSENKLDPDEALISSGLVDSFSLVDLALFVEDNFNVIIDDTELNADTFDTARQLAGLIQERMA